MLKDKAYEYFITRDHNCAETTLLAAGEEYGLGIGPEEMKLVSAFGGGMGCGKLCGVLAGSMAALGRLAVNGRAHATENFGPLCAGLCESFEAGLGSLKCADLKAMYRNDEVRCLKTVELGLDVFEAYVKEKGLVPAEK
jgi:C_GCAxxG_C_C family probable redox protein